LERLHQQVILLSRLVEDLRTLSLAESGGLNLQLEDINLNTFLQQTINSLMPRANEANVIIQLHPVPDTSIYIDSKQITRVLNNLLDNALRYGKSPIEVSAQNLDRQCTITIRDHGEGLSQETLERAFERFYKADSARARTAHSGGSGLGLSIAKAIVEAHHGKLEAKNHPQGGAVFEISLPYSALQKT
jgi:two-component system sensor histidine kinase BaeS